MFAFLRLYSNYYQLTIHNTITYYCNNEEIKNKQHNIQQNYEYYNRNKKMSEHGATYILKQYLPVNIK